MNLQTQMSQAAQMPMPNVLVTLVDNEPMVSSLKIAESFSKKHKDVLKAIRNLECSESFNQRNFAPVTETVERATGGISIPAFNMTRDGFTFLVMGFNGKSSGQWKEKYISAFNAMETQIKQSSLAPDFSDPRNLLACFEHLNGKVQQLEGTVVNQNIRLHKLDRIETAEGSICLTDAAKAVKLRPKMLFSILQTWRWIYRRVGSSWIGYQGKVQAGYLEHTEHTYTKSDGETRVSVQVKVTPKGLLKIAELLEKPLH